MRHLLSILSLLFILSAPVRADITIHQSFESSADGTAITKAILDAGNLNSAGTWGVTNFTDGTGTMLAHKITTSFEQALLRPIIIGSATNTDIGSTRGLRMSTTTAKREYIYCNFTSTAKISFGCYIRIGTGFSGSTFASFDHIMIDGGGQFLVLNYQDFSPRFWQVHTQVGTADSNGGGATNTFVAASNKTYYVTGIYDSTSGANGVSTIWFYDPVTWLRVGTSVLANTAKINATAINFGNYEPHGVTAPGTLDFDDIQVDPVSAQFPLLPGSGLKLAASASSTDVAAAQTVATAGDTLIIPSGSNVWTSTLNITKQLTISGMGTNTNPTILTNKGSPDTMPLLSLQVPGITVSNLVMRGTNIAAANTNLCGYGIETTTNGIEISHVLMVDLEAALSFNGRGYVHNSIFVDCLRVGRHFGYVAGGAALWDNDRPLLSTTRSNFVVWENFSIHITTNFVKENSSISFFSGQEACSYVIRFATCRVDRAVNIAPAIDIHGNDPGIPSLRGSLALQVYKFRIEINSPATFDGKFADLRGAQSNYTAYSVLVYSNIVTGYDVLDDVTVREEDASAPYIDILTGCYVFENYEGASGTSLMPLVVAAGSGSKLTLNSEYFTNAPPVGYTNWSFPYPYGSDGAAFVAPPPYVPGVLKIRTLRFQ